MIWTEPIIQEAIYRETHDRSLIVIPNYTPAGWFECDIFQVTRARYPVEYEIKTNLSDLRREKKKRRKHLALPGKIVFTHQRPRRFWYVVPEEIAARAKGEIPEYAGLMVASQTDLDLRHKKMPGGKCRITLRCKKQAPNLPAEKIPEGRLLKIYQAFYYRYWHLRRDLADLRAQRAQGGENGQG